MPKHSFQHRKIFSVLIVLFITISGCQRATEPLVNPATPTPAAPSQPAPVENTATPASTPTPDPYGWQPVNLDALSGIAPSAQDPACASLAAEASPEEWILGADQTTCTPLQSASQVRLSSAAALGAAGELVALEIGCGGSGPCMQIPAGEPAWFQVSLEDGSVLWASDCSAQVMCPSADHPLQVTIRQGLPGPLSFELSTSPGATWRVGTVQAAVLPPQQAGLIQGYAYSPFRDCQMPDIGPFPSGDEIQADLMRIANSGNAIRTYSSQGINAEIVRRAADLGLSIGLGVALGPEAEKNEAEIEAARILAAEVPVDFLIVGNEVILRGELSPQEVADYMREAKRRTGLPVAYAEIGSFFVEVQGAGQISPRESMLPIIEAADILLVHLYPYWDGIDVEQGAAYVALFYSALQVTFPDKRVVIGETGWPSRGEPRGSAVASLENQRRFFMEFTALAQHRDIEHFYFAPFEEPWKANEGAVGPSWGVVTVERASKFESESLFFPRQAPNVNRGTPWPHYGAQATQPAVEITGQPPAESVVNTPPLVLYREFPFPGPLGPSAWQGDWGDLVVDACWGDHPYSQPEALKLEYTAQSAGSAFAEGWVGIVWESQHPEGEDVRLYNQVRFYARGEQGGERVTFFFGGERTNLAACLQGEITCVAQTLPPALPTTLSQDWQLYTLDVSSLPRGSVVDGLGWVASACQNPDGVTFYLDDVELVSDPAALPTEPQPLTLMESGCLAPGYDLGIDTSGEQREWAQAAEDSLRLVYPTGQQWGAAFIFVDLAEWELRPYIDLSAYSTLEVELRGGAGGEQVQVGMKDNDDPDDGNEPKRRQALTGEWATYRFPLAAFQRGRYSHPDRIYIPLELVFGRSGLAPVEVYLRSVKLVP